MTIRTQPRRPGAPTAPDALVVPPGTTVPGRAHGRGPLRREGPAKLTGQAKYADDLVFPGAWYGATIRSTEARATLLLIDAGGPFPYGQDGAVFQNREGLLPDRAEGHYREYTVPTPGEDDRGARRIVAGANGERYWTADHYASFAWIAR